MRMIVKKPASEPEYSLHDAHIMELQAEKDTLRLVTQYGYVCTAAPYGQVVGMWSSPGWTGTPLTST